MATYLVKTEPSEFSFADLLRAERTAWSGVSNPQALVYLRATRVGDEVFVYHTGNEKAIVGLARVVRGCYEDPQRPGRTPDGDPRFAVIDLTPIRPAATPVTLAAIKCERRFKDFLLVKNSRLSVMPVPPALDRAVRAMAGI